MTLFSHGSSKFFDHLFKAYGSRNICAPAYAQCRGPREVGFQLTYGDWVHSPERTDIENAKCLLILGTLNVQIQAKFLSGTSNQLPTLNLRPKHSIHQQKMPGKKREGLIMTDADLSDSDLTGTTLNCFKKIMLGMFDGMIRTL